MSKAYEPYTAKPEFEEMVERVEKSRKGNNMSVPKEILKHLLMDHARMSGLLGVRD